MRHGSIVHKADQKQTQLSQVRAVLLTTLPALVMALLWFQMGQWYHGRLLMREHMRVQTLARRYADEVEWSFDRALGLIKSKAIGNRSPATWHVAWTEPPRTSPEGQYLLMLLRVEDAWGQGYGLAQSTPLRPIMQAAGIDPPPEGLSLALLDAHGRTIYGPQLADMAPVSDAVILPGTFWRLAAVPTEGWEGAIRSEFWMLQGSMGAFFAATMVIVHRALRRQRRLARDVDRGVVALRLSEASFRHLFNSVPDPLLVVTPSGQLVEANDQARQRLMRDDRMPHDLAAWLREHGVTSDITHKELLSSDNHRCFLSLVTDSTETSRRHFEASTTAFMAEDGQPRLLIVLNDVTTRYLSEKALRASEERYRQLVENSPEGILLLRLDGRLTVANRPAAELAGYAEPDSLLHAVQRLTDLVDASDRERLAEAFLSALANDVVHGEIFSLVQRDGERLPVETSIAVQTDDEGQASGLIVAMRDVSLRMQAQARNRSYRERLTNLARAMSALIDMPDEPQSYALIAQDFVALSGARAAYLSRYDADRRTLIPTGFAGEPNVEHALLQHIGSTMLGNAYQVPEELHDLMRRRGLQRLPDLALVSLGLIGPSDEALVRRNMGVESVCGVALARNDTTLGASLMLLAKDATPQFSEVIEAYAHAVTSWMHRHNSDRVLRESEERYRGVITNLGDAIVFLDQDLRITYCQDTFSQSLGIASQEPLGKPFERLFAQFADQGMTAPELRHLLEGDQGILRMHDLLWETADRGPARFDVALFAVVYDARPHVALLMRDVTERYDLLLRLRQRERLEDLGTFAEGAAHDLRHIVALIRHEVPVLEQAIGSENQEAHGILRMVERALLLGDHVTTTLVDHGRDLDLAPSPLHINLMLRQAQPLMKQLLGDHISLHLDLSEKLVFCLADEALVGRAWLNLLINARDAMPHGGTVTLGTRLQIMDGHQDPSSDLAPGTYGVISVADTGPGMTTEQRERAFDPYYSTKRTSLATGLGLAVVHRVMQQHGGTVEVRSQPGQGTTFELYFPALPAQAISHGMADLND